MPVSVVNPAQTANAATATLAATVSTSGDVLVCFVTQSVITGGAPTLADNSADGVPWVNVGTNALFNTSLAAVYAFTKVANATTPGARTLTATPGTGGTIQGLSYFEVLGAVNVIRGAAGGTSNNQTSLSTASGLTVATPNPNSGDLFCAAVGHTATSGAVGAWTGGTGGVNPTNVASTTTRTNGGYAVMTATGAYAATSNWANSQVNGMLSFILEAAATATAGLLPVLP